MLRSFKLKMALFAVCTSGVILVAFSCLFLSFIRRAGAERIDRQLVALADGQLRRSLPPEYWPQFDENLSTFHGDDNRRRFLVKVIARDGSSLYTSPRWPAALTGAELTLPDLGVPPAFGEPLSPGRSGPPFPRPFRPDEERPLRRMRATPPKFMTLYADKQCWRFAAMRNPNVTLLIGTNLADLQAEQKRFLTAFEVTVPIGLFLLAAGGWFLAGQALRPVKILTRMAGGMTAKGLSQRVHVLRSDREFQALIDVINGMLDRLETSFNQAARFSADAAHELKTPLTILQGQLNQALQSAVSGSDQQRTYADLLEEVQRLKSIVRKLLLLAQSDSGQLRLTQEDMCLTDEIEALVEDAPLLAPGLTFHTDLAPDVHMRADPELLRHVIQNLFSNAVKYNHAGGLIECCLRQRGGTVTLILANTTDPGLRSDRERIFDRFYRGDPSRNRRIEGNGLGLSLAREISRAHGGDLTVDTDETREGWIAFKLILPCEG